MAIIHDPIGKRIDVLDERFYTKDGIVYYPSVTTVLDALPKGYGYTQWLKDMGSSADEVVKRAANTGSTVHNAIEKYLRGGELTWADDDGFAQYSFDEWMMILKFIDFWTTYKPTLLGVEMTLISDKYKLGGTLDITCMINGERWLIDTKTSNYIYDSHSIQIAAYKVMWDEINPEYPVQRTGILHLRADTRGADKTGKKIQGKGWRLHEFEEPNETRWETFQHLRYIWDRCNPDYRPKNQIYPDRVKLNL